MKIIVGNNENQIEVKRIYILMADDIEFHISVNPFGELIIHKAQFGSGESAIVIKPSVSNEIRLS